MIESYRSYVIRVRRRSTDEPVRLDLEDLLGGRRVAVVGDEAQLLAERLLWMIASGDVQLEAQPEVDAVTPDHGLFPAKPRAGLPRRRRQIKDPA